MASATPKHRHYFFAFYDFYFVLDYNPRQKWLGRLYNLTEVHFNPQKREFSLSLNIPPPPPPIQCWDITEQLRAQH